MFGTLINFILDAAGLILWLSWRSIPFDPLRRPTPATLAGTVRRAAPTRLKRWHFLAALAGLLLFRSVCYWQIRPALGWTPRLDFGVVALAFGNSAFITALLFSLISFGRVWIVFHFWLLSLWILNAGTAQPGPIQKLIQLQLGWVTRWPLGALAVLPFFLVAALWTATQPMLAWAGVVHRVQSGLHLAGQGAILGASLYFTLKDLLPVILLLSLVASYVYMGASPVWDYITATSRRVLSPLSGLPLRGGRVDFAPLAGIVLILLLLHALPEAVMALLNRRNLTMWPE